MENRKAKTKTVLRYVCMQKDEIVGNVVNGCHGYIVKVVNLCFI